MTAQRSPGRLFIRTFGCQMNEYDSSKMADVLRESHGFEPAATRKRPMSCCSTPARSARRRRRRCSPCWALAGAEAGAARRGDRGRRLRGQPGRRGHPERAPFVDLVFGPQTLHRLPAMLDAVRRPGPVVDISFPEIEKFDNLPAPRAEGPTAFVSVMEGCSKYCTFCVVPYTRGEEVSRPFDDVIAEIARLAAQGVREINLLGQNVNAYRGAMHDGTIADLAAADPLRGRHRRHRPDPLHHLASAGVHRQR
jgi:tRNA-2-methylthio-N6-dimethylallyladenosine synthase